MRDCGAGSLALPNSILCPASRTVSMLWVKTLTAHSWSAGKAESTDSLTEQPRPIHCLIPSTSSWPEGCYAIAMAGCGSGLLAGGLCMYTRGEPMCLHRLMVSQPRLFTVSLRIGKAVSGCLQETASTAFVT